MRSAGVDGIAGFMMIGEGEGMWLFGVDGVRGLEGVVDRFLKFSLVRGAGVLLAELS